MEFKRIGILGAGAVGAYVIWGLSQKPGTELFLIAEGARKERLEKNGLTINGKSYFLPVKMPGEACAPDLLVIALKYTALRDALPAIRRVVSPGTTVMSLMNGVDSEDVIASATGSECIVHSVIKVASERHGNGIVFDPETTIGIVYGEAGPEKDTERIRALESLFAGTGMHCRATDCILNEIWQKYLLNVSKNLPQAVIGCGVGAYDDSEHLMFLRTKLRDEVVAVAAAKGIDLSVVDKSSLVGSAIKKRARYSTLQDLDAKRPTEIDMLAGALVRMGRELNVPTPYAEYTFHAIKALEEKNAGLFDYE